MDKEIEISSINMPQDDDYSVEDMSEQII